MRAARLAKQTSVNDAEDQAPAEEKREIFREGGFRRSIAKGDLEEGFEKGDAKATEVAATAPSDRLHGRAGSDENKLDFDEMENVIQDHARILNEDVRSTTTVSEAPPRYEDS